MSTFDLRKIKPLIKAKGYTQNAFAAHINMDKSQFSRLLNRPGKTVTYDTLERLAVGLDINTAWLVDICKGNGE